MQKVERWGEGQEKQLFTKYRVSALEDEMLWDLFHSDINMINMMELYA